MSLVVDIKKHFKGFSLEMQFESDGRPLGILGASGCGKSMTLKCIAGIETPDEGHIEVNGRVLYDSRQKINVKPQKRQVGYLFQSYALFPHMTVEENIACALRGAKEQKDARIQALLRQYELEGLEKRYPGQLSGGQQQRAALARILAYEPDVLLLDEPFSALDTYLKEALQADMRKLLRQYNGQAVMVTHNRDEVYTLSRNLLAMEDGRAVEMGNTRSLFQKPRHLTTARLTGCKNFSRARAAGQNRVEALDWGCTLDVAGPVPEGMTHIGVRAHYFRPGGAGGQNTLPIRVLQQVETPFEWNVLFQNANAPPGSGKIWWKYTKDSGVGQLPQNLCISAEDVLLLEEDKPSGAAL